MDLDALLRRADDAGARFSREAAESIAAAIEEELSAARPGERERIAAWAGRERAAASAAEAWVRARVRDLLGETEAAIQAWGACFRLLAGIEPEGLLHRARALLRAGRGEEAASDLRLALQQPADYDFWTRAEKVYRRMLRAGAPGSRRELRLAVLSGKASVSLFAPLLRLGAFRDHIALELFEGGYDSFVQDIVDAEGPLAAFRPQVVLLPLHWRDAGLPPCAEDPDALVRETVQRVTDLCRMLRERLSCSVVVHAFDLPAPDAYGRLGTQLAGARGSLLRRINAELLAGAPPDVFRVDLERLAAACPVWVDPKQWHLARQHPASAALPALVEEHLAVLRGLLGLTRKVLVLDLDNTLWGGVIGEDGLEQIQLGPTSPTGEAFQEFQRYLRELKERGVLLAVCSKNNESDARLPFQAHPDRVLGLDDFVAFVANWEDKASNLRELARTLSLGLDSFVFVDDNPVERAWVRAQIPEVAVPELPRDPSEFARALARAGYFEAVAVSAEDRARSAGYRANVERERLRGAVSDLPDFLTGLGMLSEHGAFDEANLLRVAQLVNKTNQFNLTTRRYREAELRSQAADPRWWTQWFRLSDRFGDNGLVGILTLGPRQGDDDAREVDTFLMSCRVLGRSMEAFMLAVAVGHCRRSGIKRLYGRYLPTAKNAQVRDLFARLGAQPLREDADGGEWLIDVPTFVPPPSFVRGAG